MTTTQRLSASLAIAVLVGGVVALVTAEGQTSATPVAAQGLATATFAGGCFWCMEPPFDKLDGVISTTSGYTGGERRHPTYGDVSSGRTAHAEAVEVVYDQAKISYRLFEEQAEQYIERFPWRKYRYLATQMRGLHASVPSFLINTHRVSTLKDAQDYVRRLEGIEGLFDQLIVNINEQADLGIIAPKFVS